MPENSRVPLIVETFEANDEDEGRFGQVVYKLEEYDDNNSNKFGNTNNNNRFSLETIDGRAVLSLIKPLDYELKSVYQLKIIAVDRAIESERLQATANILITVEDVDDTPPMFTFVPPVTRIAENLKIGSPIVRVNAVDGDRGVNNRVSYSIEAVTSGGNSDADSSAQLFSIDSNTGLISVARELDRELDAVSSVTTGSGGTNAGDQPQQAGAFVLTIKATEVPRAESHASSTITTTKQQQSVSTELTIILTDVNDQLPTFSRQAYFGELLENSLADSIVSFVAESALVSHSLPPGYAHKETALGGGDLSQQNDASGGRSLSLPVVVDRDQGSNGTFTLHLEGESAHLFDIWPREATNEANFIIKLRANGNQIQGINQLDFEITKSLQFAIVAREKFNSFDGTGASKQQLRSNSASMTVFIRDVNDNYPQFESDTYKVEIPENAVRGMHVCVVKATDIDSGIYGSSGIRYTELRGEIAQMFRLDPLSGVVTLATNEHGFDRELVSQHHLIVEARDFNGLGNRNTTQLVIVLTDINDEKPKFLLDQYEAFVYENEKEFQSPLQTLALDYDQQNTPNSMITYSIESGDLTRNFSIDPKSGKLTINSVNGLDFEKMTPQTIETVNSYRRTPNSMMTSLSDDKHINEDKTFSTSTSSDEDFPDYQHNSVHHLNNNNNNNNQQQQQRDDSIRIFNLTVKASDSGQPEPLASTTRVLIFVRDRNDHAPVFDRQLYSRTLREDAREGSLVLQVHADDKDASSAYNKVSYRITSGGGDKFVIDSESGIISVAAGANLDVDRVGVGGPTTMSSQQHKKNNYLLTVAASDGSFSPTSLNGNNNLNNNNNHKLATTLVNITITDFNNKPPEFVIPTQVIAASSSQQRTTGASSGTGGMQVAATVSASVVEDAPFGLAVVRMRAIDLDSSAQLRYSINYARSEGRNEEGGVVEASLIRDMFAIDTIDGTVSVARPLDREMCELVKLKVQVEDIAAQTSDQTASANLIIKIIDVNDNKPVFLRPIYFASLAENSMPNTPILSVSAEDRDANKSSLRYSIDSISTNLPESIVSLQKLVKINPKTGELFTSSEKIDRETTPLLNVTLRATDDGNLSSTAQLLITIRDENDNNPVFVEPLIGTHTGDTLSSTTDSPATDQAPQHRRRLSPPDFENSLGPVASDSSQQQVQLVGPNGAVVVREDAVVGLEFARVKAEDADSGAHGRVTYLLESDESSPSRHLFRIDRDSGVMSVAGPLDREKAASHILMIEACDNYELGRVSGASRRSFARVTVLIADVNDNAPQVHLLAGNSPAVTSLSQQAAVNSQRSTRTTSQLSTDELLNSQGPFATPMPDCVLIDELHPMNEPILTLTASDLDDSRTPNARVELAIANGPSGSNELFALQQVPITSTDLSSSSSHSINNEHSNNVSSSYTQQPMKLVVVQSLKGRVGNYSVLVRATDFGEPVALSSLKAINVCILDVNDHAPIFTSPTSLTNNRTIIRLMENSTLNSFVVRVEAVDSDFGLNSAIRYSLKPAAGNSQADYHAFQINKLSGVITTATQSFNRQSKRRYNFRVQASDLGTPSSLSSDIDVSVIIVAVGNRQPEFSKSQVQVLEFGENLEAGSESFILLATSSDDDEDEDQNQDQENNKNQDDLTTQSSNAKKRGPNTELLAKSATPCYFIVASDETQSLGNSATGSGSILPFVSQNFQLEPLTHRLTTKRRLDREMKSNYTLLIRASSQCNPSAIPHLTGAISYASLYSVNNPTMTVHSNIDSIAARRRTKRSSGIVASQKSTLSKKSLQVNTEDSEHMNAVSTFDYAKIDAMLAEDKSLLKLIINIRDDNDNKPKFSQSIYTGGLTTESEFGTVFMIVHANDADSEINAQVMYEIVKPIRRNLLPSTSSSNPNNNIKDNVPSQTTITNNKAARSKHQEDSSSLQSTNSLPDDIQLANGEDLFVINNSSGEISLNFFPQRHMKGYFEFTVKASDFQGLSDTANVFVSSL